MIAGRMVRLTPNGLSVMSRQRAISLVRSSGVGCVSAVMSPSAPALATAATSSARPTHCMPPWTIGCSTPNSSVKRVLIMSALWFPRAFFRRAEGRARFFEISRGRMPSAPAKVYRAGRDQGNAIMQKRGFCFRGMDNSAWCRAFWREPGLAVDVSARSGKRQCRFVSHFDLRRERDVQRNSGGQRPNGQR